MRNFLRAENEIVRIPLFSQQFTVNLYCPPSISTGAIVKRKKYTLITPYFVYECEICKLLFIFSKSNF
jgi:hypothetical protein